MILATHALTGAVIGKNFYHPGVIFVLSLTIHFTMDSFRHGEYFDSRVATIKNTWWKIALDLSIGFFFIFSAIYFRNFDSYQIRNILLVAFFSMFPDLLTVLFWQFKWKWLAKIKNFHSWAHCYNHFPKYSFERQWTLRNARNDILFSLLAIFLLFI